MKQIFFLMFAAIFCHSVFSWEVGDVYVSPLKVSILTEINVDDKDFNDDLANLLNMAKMFYFPADTLEMPDETLDVLKKIDNELQKYDEAYSRHITEQFLSMPESEFIKKTFLYSYDNIKKREDRHQSNYFDFKKIPLVFYDLAQISTEKRLLIYAASYPFQAPHYPKVRRQVFLRVIFQNGKNVEVTTLPRPIHGFWALSGSESDSFYLGYSENKDTTIPDIFVLEGPGGSGNFFEVCRYSYDSKTQSWKSIVVLADSGLSDYSIDRKQLMFYWKNHEGNHTAELKNIN